MPTVLTNLLAAIDQVKGSLSLVAFLAVVIAWVLQNKRITELLSKRLGLDRHLYYRLMVLSALILFTIVVFALAISIQATGVELYILVSTAVILSIIFIAFGSRYMKTDLHPQETVLIGNVYWDDKNSGLESISNAELRVTGLQGSWKTLDGGYFEIPIRSPHYKSKSHEITVVIPSQSESNPVTITTQKTTGIKIKIPRSLQNVQPPLNGNGKEEKTQKKTQPLSFKGESPFQVGGIVRPESFYGRKKQLDEIKKCLTEASASCISISGMQWIGKSSLLYYVASLPEKFCKPSQRPTVIHLDMQMMSVDSVSSLISYLSFSIQKQIPKAIDTSSWTYDGNESIQTLLERLQQVVKEGYRPFILVDEFEYIGREKELAKKFGEVLQNMISEGLCTIITSSVAPLNEAYKKWGGASPFKNLYFINLGAFEKSEWQILVQDGFRKSGVMLNDTDLELIYDLSGGFPFLTQMAASNLLKTGDHNAARDAFANNSASFFRYLWSVSEVERSALRFAAGVPRALPPNQRVRTELQRRGLLRPDGLLFSSAFADFVKSQE